MLTVVLNSIFYTITAFSIVGNFGVSVEIAVRGFRTMSSRLALYLHITQLIQDVSSLPAYSINSSLCECMGFLRVYSSIANASVVACMVTVALELLFPGMVIFRYIESQHNHKWKTLIVFVLPLLTFLPFSTTSYGQGEGDRSEFCSLKSDPLGNLWSFIIYYPWIWSMLAYSCVAILFMLCKLRSWPDIQAKVFKSLGLYSTSDIFVWSFRLILRIDPKDNTARDYYVSYLLTAVEGIICTAVYMFERRSLQKFELQYKEDPNAESEDYSVESIYTVMTDAVIPGKPNSEFSVNSEFSAVSSLNNL